MKNLNNNLRAALIQVADGEIGNIEIVADSKAHIFSDSFLNKMDKVIEGSDKKYSTIFRRRVRRSSLAAAAVILMLCMSITVYAIVKANIPFNIGSTGGQSSDGDLINPNMTVLIEGSSDTELQGTFEYKIPATPEGFQEVSRSEESLGLIITYENASGESIIYSQAFGEGGQADLEVREDGVLSVSEEIINDRNAVITHHYDDLYTIMVEDGTSVFLITGNCDYDIIYNIAVEITS